MTPTGETSCGRPIYELTQDLVFQDSHHESFGVFVFVRVPRGFKTDLASIPWGFRWLLAKWPEPAAMHDFLYGLPEFSRVFADAFFRAAMESMGVPWGRRVLAFYAVRIFGAGRNAK